MTISAQSNLTRTVHVEGRTPGPRGVAPMVVLRDGVQTPPLEEGSNHVAVYLGAMGALSEALLDGVTDLTVTSPSKHLIEQMKGDWKVGHELINLHRSLQVLAAMFSTEVRWRIAPRTAP